jgi:hypothetical protein
MFRTKSFKQKIMAGIWNLRENLLLTKDGSLNGLWSLELYLEHHHSSGQKLEIHWE